MKALLMTAFVAGLGVWAAGPDSAKGPKGMTCRDTTVVEYHAGPNWKAFDIHVNGHLEFLRTLMKRGKILYGGPFSSEKGGLSVYDLVDPDAVDALVTHDPLVAHKVVTYSIKSWRMCSPQDDK